MSSTPHQSHSAMPDVQGRPDLRQLPINRVGIKSLRYPLSVIVAGQTQPTVGTWTLDVALSAEQKGTHMSRLVAWLDQLASPLTMETISSEINSMLSMLGAEYGQIEVDFPFFIRKTAPVTGVQSLLEYNGRWMARRDDQQVRLSMQVRVPVKTLCPCSKEVSDDGAHNQRSLITVQVDLHQAMDWSELVSLAERQASSELWSLLKRPDEKWVTERAYANPLFVEDLVRDVALALEAEQRVSSYRVEVTNYESIHAHDAYAVIERTKG